VIDSTPAKYLSKQRSSFSGSALSAVLVAVFGALLPAFAVAQNPTPVSSRLRTPLPFDPAVTTGTLPNGMRFYIRENKRPENRAELRLVLNAGKGETKRRTGVVW